MANSNFADLNPLSLFAKRGGCGQSPREQGWRENVGDPCKNLVLSGG
jgi:hypothetical protein